ncbi:MAG: autotransporter domain-containing protein [Rickettsiales bacterium]|nr:autotransporter domain-containing protein [Rickettsiales bacterium]
MKNQKFLGLILPIIFILGCGIAYGNGADVSTFEELQTAVANKKTPINFLVDALEFKDSLQVDYSLELFGKKNGITKLDGGNSNNFFNFTPEAATFTVDSVEFIRNLTHSSDEAAIHIDEGSTNYLFRNSSFAGNNSSKEGGVIYAEENSSLTFEGVTTFTKNFSSTLGGVIYSKGSADNKNNLIFKDSVYFENNSSSECYGGGGAIYAINSNLRFIRGDDNSQISSSNLVFRNNLISGGNGGSIYLEYSDFEFETKVNFHDGIASYGGAMFLYESSGTFGGADIPDSDRTFSFRRNIASIQGGAIYIGNFNEFSYITFRGPVVFESNIARHGGAMYVDGYLTEDKSENLTFDRMVIFRKNSADFGGVMCINYNTNVNFNAGLRLWNNTTNINFLSGAITVNGHNIDTMATVNITQNDPNNYSIFKNPRSNAIYMEGRATINFNIEKGDVYLYDAIIGRQPYSPEYPNVINIYGDGWFNVREGGSIVDNIILNNQGKLSLTNPEATELNLTNFTNSGTIQIGIFPENNVCDKIRAGTITIAHGSILNVVAAKGTYSNGNTYDILISEEPIVENDGAKINLILQPGINATGMLSDDGKIYRIVLRNEITLYNSHPYMDKLELEDDEDYMLNRKYSNYSFFKNIEGLDYSQYSVASSLDDILNAEEDTDIKNAIYSEIINKLTPEEQKIVLSQLSAHFPADVISAVMLSNGLYNNFLSRAIISDAGGFWIEPLYTEIKLAKKTKDSLLGALVGINYNFGNVPIGFHINLNKHSISGEHSSKATVETAAIGFHGGLILDSLDMIFILEFHKGNYNINRSIEKLDKVANSELSSNTLSIAAEIGVKFEFVNFMTLRPFIGIQQTELVHGDVSEKDAGVFNLEIENAKHSLAVGRLGFGLMAIGNFEPFVNLEGKYIISGKTPELSAHFLDSGNYPIKSIGTEYTKFILDVSAGFNQKLWKRVIFSLVANYQNSASIGILSAGIGLKWKL